MRPIGEKQRRGVWREWGRWGEGEKGRRGEGEKGRRGEGGKIDHSMQYSNITYVSIKERIKSWLTSPPPLTHTHTNLDLNVS